MRKQQIGLVASAFLMMFGTAIICYALGGMAASGKVMFLGDELANRMVGVLFILGICSFAAACYCISRIIFQIGKYTQPNV